MTTQVQPRIHITDPDFQTGFDEANDPYYADCGIRSDEALVNVIRCMLTEVAVESGLSEQQVETVNGLYCWLIAFRIIEETDEEQYVVVLFFISLK